MHYITPGTKMKVETYTHTYDMLRLWLLQFGTPNSKTWRGCLLENFLVDCVSPHPSFFWRDGYRKITYTLVNSEMGRAYLPPHTHTFYHG